MHRLASKLFWLSILLFCAYIVSQRGTGSEYEDAKADSARYCEDVAIWRHTKGVYGHPATRGTKECEE